MLPCSINLSIANDVYLRLVGRSLQGVGDGGILILGEILVTDLVPLAASGGE